MAINILEIVIVRLSGDEANDRIRSWLDKCHFLRRLDFSPNYMIGYNINTAKSGGLSTDKFGEVKDRKLIFV
ncbi:MAG: hypothetical protein WBP64_04805 [Nitrososphaeraceae archaeon]